MRKREGDRVQFLVVRAQLSLPSISLQLSSVLQMSSTTLLSHHVFSFEKSAPSPGLHNGSGRGRHCFAMLFQYPLPRQSLLIHLSRAPRWKEVTLWIWNEAMRSGNVLYLTVCSMCSLDVCVHKRLLVKSSIRGDWKMFWICNTVVSALYQDPLQLCANLGIFWCVTIGSCKYVCSGEMSDQAGFAHRVSQLSNGFLCSCRAEICLCSMCCLLLKKRLFSCRPSPQSNCYHFGSQV